VAEGLLSSLWTIDAPRGMMLENTQILTKSKAATLQPNQAVLTMTIKLSAAICLSWAMLAVCGATASGQSVLFADTFNRANNTSLSADSTGMSGTLGPVGYLESWEGSPANVSTWQVANNQLLKGQTGIMGAGAVNHNFTDSSMVAAGGFSVSLDILSYGTQTLDLPDRWGGFGVGLALAEVNAFTDENTGNTGPRGSIANDGVASQVGVYGMDAWMHTGVADFYVDVSKENKVQVFSGGMLLNQFPVTPTGSRTLTANFSFKDFNVGSQVNYTVLFEGSPVTSGSFNWSNTDQNYIALSARDSIVTMDNLVIATIPEPSTFGLLLVGAASLFICRRRP
jgi:hypothetical protein